LATHDCWRTGAHGHVEPERNSLSLRFDPDRVSRCPAFERLMQRENRVLGPSQVDPVDAQQGISRSQASLLGTTAGNDGAHPNPAFVYGTDENAQ